jgi:hypothetical protein
MRQFLGPDWRRQTAIAASTECNRGRAAPDEITRRAADYFRLRAQSDEGATRAAQRYPDFAAAEATWANVTLREHLQILVLGDCPAAEIAERLGLEESGVLLAEGLHFDVRPALDATVWIAHLIWVEADRGRDSLAAEMRMAYFGGACAARALLDAKTGLPVKPVERLAAATLLLQAKMLQVSELPVDEKRSVELLRLLSEIRLEEQRIALEREKLLARMQRWAGHRDLVQARLDLERERLSNQIGGAEVRAAAAESDSPVSLTLPSASAA